MKLINTTEYLLLIDEEAEIKEKDYKYHHVTGIRIAQVDGKYTNQNKVLAYYLLKEGVKELDLPLLPNPFDDEYIYKLANKAMEGGKNLSNGLIEYRRKAVDFAFDKYIEGYKAAQSDKLFSLEDMKNFQTYLSDYWISSQAYENLNEMTFEERNDKLFKDFIQSLSSTQLPKSFEPEYKYEKGWKGEWTEFISYDKLKTIINSNGKQELVGKYIY